MTDGRGVVLFLAALSAAAAPSTALERWEKGVTTATSGPKASQIEREAGRMGVDE